MSDNLEQLSKERERFAIPSSLEDLNLTHYIEDFLARGIEQYGGYCDCFSEQIADAIYDIKAHNGSHDVIRDKCKKICEYTNYLKQQGLSEDEKNFLKNNGFKVPENGSISKDTAGYLWASYWDRNNSLAAHYETNLKNNIKEAIEEVINYWKANSIINYLQAHKSNLLKNANKI